MHSRAVTIKDFVTPAIGYWNCYVPMQLLVLRWKGRVESNSCATSDENEYSGFDKFRGTIYYAVKIYVYFFVKNGGMGRWGLHYITECSFIRETSIFLQFTRVYLKSYFVFMLGISHVPLLYFLYIPPLINAEIRCVWFVFYKIVHVNKKNKVYVIL
jgi:hypothetical protein